MTIAVAAVEEQEWRATAMPVEKAEKPEATGQRESISPVIMPNRSGKESERREGRRETQGVK